MGRGGYPTAAFVRLRFVAWIVEIRRLALSVS